MDASILDNLFQSPSSLIRCWVFVPDSLACSTDHDEHAARDPAFGALDTAHFQFAR